MSTDDLLRLYIRAQDVVHRMRKQTALVHEITDDAEYRRADAELMRLYALREEMDAEARAVGLSGIDDMFRAPDA